MTELKILAIIALIIVVVSSFIGAIYLEPASDSIKSATLGTPVQGLGDWVANSLNDLGHSLKMAWIFAGAIIFLVLCGYVYIKTRPHESSGSYYDHY